MKAPDTATLERLITEAMQSNDWATVHDLEPRLDAVTQGKGAPPAVSAALWYAAHGLAVFPLQPHRKLPYKGTRGCKDATNNPDTIISWWQKWPDSNLAIATGFIVDVIDIDGPEGVHSWAQMNGLPPILGTVSTPRPGGSHLYIAAAGHHNGAGSRAGLPPGVDMRGLGGYVVAPPSVNEEGVRYTWRRPPELP